MKKYIHLISVLIALLVISGCVMLSSCSDAPAEETAKEKTLTLLSRTWQVSNVRVDGVDKTDSFNGLKLTFASGAYTSLNGDPLWMSSGAWSFTSDEATSFTRNDAIVVTITTITESNLKLSLHWNKTLGGGRIDSIGGNYVFELSN